MPAAAAILREESYKGHNAPAGYKFKVYTQAQKRGVTGEMKRQFRRRAAIEPVIGHTKSEHRMERNYLAHRAGDAINAVLPAAGLSSADQGKLRRHVGIGGITFRPFLKLSITGDVEGASSDGAYFRTSLYNYQKLRTQAHYKATGSLMLGADFTLLHNDNPLAGSKYSYQAQQESLSFTWTPRGGKIWDIQGSYSCSTMYSDIGYLEPENLLPQQFIYRDNAHTATALFDVNLPRYLGVTGSDGPDQGRTAAARYDQGLLDPRQPLENTRWHAGKNASIF